MTPEESIDHRKNLALLVSLIRENLTLRELVMQAFPEDGANRIAAATSDPVIQNMVAVQMAAILEADRRLADAVQRAEDFVLEDERPRKQTHKPH